MSKESNELEDSFKDYLKEGVRAKEGKPGDKAVISAFKKALAETTPERPGDPLDDQYPGKKSDDKLEWW